MDRRDVFATVPIFFFINNVHGVLVYITQN